MSVSMRWPLTKSWKKPIPEMKILYGPAVGVSENS
jgi:hypothetical protein